MTSPRPLLSRRRLLGLGAAGAGSLLLAGCDRWSAGTSDFRKDVLDRVDELTEGAQRLVMRDTSLAREYGEADISSYFRANGNIRVNDREYNRLAEGAFAEYRLPVTGLVDRPLSLSMADIRGMPARTQITRHDCVEGWSCIGKWTGPQLGPILDLAGVQPTARFVMFYCYDDFGNTLSGPIRYYESLGIRDCYHPQTILAWGMNDGTLPIPHGAPLRLRVERQLGYKHAKFLREIRIVDSFENIGRGHGGYYEDGDGYEWYAGI
jgi:DMSO/TMAO reductase YedYZ molybdopterin-dependent catalytic subunit